MQRIIYKIRYLTVFFNQYKHNLTNLQQILKNILKKFLTPEYIFMLMNAIHKLYNTKKQNFIFQPYNNFIPPLRQNLLKPRIY